MKEPKIALAQITCNRADKKANLQKMKKFIELAKKEEAKLIVFPELSITGYTLRDQFYELAEHIPGTTVTILEKIAKKEDMYIIFGMPELSEKTQMVIYNTAVLIGPEGYVGKYRKMYLPTHSVFEEKRYFRQGYSPEVFETEVGKIGMMICYDVFFPEVSRLLRLKGAQFLVCISASPTVRRHFFEILTAARAIENTAFLAFVNLVGRENGLLFWGGSRLITPSGEIIVEAKHNEEDIVIGAIDYSSIKPVEAFVPTLRDIRPELFYALKEESEEL
jgi:predicted amidohydrolase